MGHNAESSCDRW